ncbi:hypothetical protein BgiBS90_027957, partial [Biomphalaria glabrata]
QPRVISGLLECTRSHFKIPNEENYIIMEKEISYDLPNQFYTGDNMCKVPTGRD